MTSLLESQEYAVEVFCENNKTLFHGDCEAFWYPIYKHKGLMGFSALTKIDKLTCPESKGKVFPNEEVYFKNLPVKGDVEEKEIKIKRVL